MSGQIEKEGERVNIQYEFWKLVAAIKQSELVKEVRIFYREEPWPATFVLSGALLLIGGMSYLIILVVHVTWPKSFYVLLSIAAIITGARQLLNWISRD